MNHYTQLPHYIALFPGQGSQSVGMGADFFDAYPLAQQYFESADKALGFSLSSLCFSGPAEELTKTEIAQPAILTVSTIVFETLKSEMGTAWTLPAVGVGHSLGEYSALVAAGALSFEDAVCLVHKRGKFMQEAVPYGTGGMVAVLKMDLAAIEDALSQVTDGVVEVENINAPGQIVLAGDTSGLDQLAKVLPGAKIRPLKVSAPFHSSRMAPAREKLAKEMEKISFKDPLFPVMSNFFATPLTKADEIKKALEEQVCGRVRFTDCCSYLYSNYTLAQGYEFGAGSVLCGLMKRNASPFPCTPLNTPKDIADLLPQNIEKASGS